MQRALNSYIEGLKSDVAALVYSDGDGASFEDKFTEQCMEILDGIGKSEGARVLSYIHPDALGRIDWKLNGYCLKDEFKDDDGKLYFETLDLFITHYNYSTYEYNITKEEFTKNLNQIRKFLNAALKGAINYIDPAKSELNELIKIIGKQKKRFDRINIFFLVNGTVNYDTEKLFVKGYEDLDVFVQIWDVPRFYKLSESNSNREPIEIEFAKFLNDGAIGIQCLKVPDLNELYECYLAIIPGYVLARLYNEFSNELLESNVRAFLGQTGKYNKGIRDTIRDKPQMFLPYNNGITATAENVEVILVDNHLYLKKVDDFQIVNGGQTTASLFHTQKKLKDVDLGKVFVQMKLTVIKDIEQKNIEVPNIARFANSQNKVSELDLSSNNPYFVQIESLSRKKYVVNPQNKNQSILWYFERVTGQYRESLNKLGGNGSAPTSVQKKFKEQNPTTHKFLKSDIAKYINIWEQEPYYVSLGAQKNFVHYTKKINDSVKKNKLPGDNFYRKLIANAILFRETDRLFGRKNVDAIGDTNIKSFTVAYTLSLLHNKTSNRLDLWKIYEGQLLPKELIEVIKQMLYFVYDHLVKSANNSLLSEYAKKESSWNKLKAEPFKISLEDISNLIISEEESLHRDTEPDVLVNKAEDVILEVSNISSLGLRFWDGLSIYSLNNENLKELSTDIWEVANKIKRTRNFSSRDIAIGKRILKLIESKEIDPEAIMILSKSEDAEVVNIKAIYDKFKLLSKNEWSKILDLGEQTQIFDYLELSNIKSIQKAINKNESIKENSLLKAEASIKKLKKFSVDF